MNIVILTGAGISAESGVRTFRASDGLWEDHRVEDVATPEGFERNPELVQRFYNQRRAQLKTVQPNAGHIALAELEKKWQHDFLLVTQNVDDLHERAGSKNLIHMHGDLLTKRCTNSGITYACHDDLCGTDFRPHIVWFGEMPLEMERIYDAIANADLFLSIGTSGNVYPAAGFVQSAKMAGAKTYEFNLEPTGNPYFDYEIAGKAGETLPKYLPELLLLKRA